MSKVSQNPPNEHPLFPAEEGDDPKPVDFISVGRHDDGRLYQIPRTFRADEITTLEDIFSLWGGGLYELWGRKASIKDPTKPGWISVNRRYQIPGASKPLMPGTEAPAPLPAVPGNPAHIAQTGAPDTSVMGMFMQMQMQMMQVAQENARAQAEANRRADERAREDSRNMMQMMMQMQASNTQSMMGVVTSVISSRGGGPDEVTKYLDLFNKLKPGGGGEGEGGAPAMGEGIEGILGSLADIVSGAVELKKGLPGGPPAPPGTAAAVFGVPMGQGMGVKPPGTGEAT